MDSNADVNVQPSPGPTSSTTSFEPAGNMSIHGTDSVLTSTAGQLNEVYLSDEVWLEILKTLPKASYPNLSLTNRQLHNIVLPTLFAHFSFHPYAVRDGQLLLPPSAAVDEAMDRLNFWASDRIAGLVRSCTISKARDDAGYTKENRPYILHNAFFEKLALFTGLKRLTASSIHFTAPDIALLAGVSGLESFSTSCCVVPLAQNMTRAKKKWSLPSFTFTALGFEEDGQELAFWLSLLNPTHLTRVVLPIGLTLAFPLRKVSEFPSVTSLITEFCCDEELDSVGHLEVLLSLFPNLQCLHISSITDDLMSEDSASSLPGGCRLSALNDLTIPGELLGTFLPATSIARLSVQSFKPGHLGDVFGSLPSYRSLVSLTATTLYLGIVDFRLILKNLPCLSRFKIVSEYWDREPNFRLMENEMASGFFNDLLSPDTKLPATLTCLAIVLNLEISFDEDFAMPHGFIDPVGICDGLRERCPKLRFLWLDGADFLISWWSARKENALRSHQVKKYGGTFNSREDDASGKFKVRCKEKTFRKVHKRLDGLWARLDKPANTIAN